MTVAPEEVAAQLAKQQKSKQQDKERETVDNEVIEQDEKPQDDLKNEEGKLMENGFKELEVEEAIEQAKEEKLLGNDVGFSSIPGNGPTKQGSYWEVLRSRIR